VDFATSVSRLEARADDVIETLRLREVSASRKNPLAQGLKAYAKGLASLAEFDSHKKYVGVVACWLPRRRCCRLTSWRVVQAARDGWGLDTAAPIAGGSDP
jgi:hypothetical protein